MITICRMTAPLYGRSTARKIGDDEMSNTEYAITYGDEEGCIDVKLVTGYDAVIELVCNLVLSGRYLLTDIEVYNMETKETIYYGVRA